MDEEDEDELEEDIVENSYYQTDSEKEISSYDEESIPDSHISADSDNDDSNDYYLDKDRTTKWRNSMANLKVRIPSYNIIKPLSGTKPYAISLRSSRKNAHKI